MAIATLRHNTTVSNHHPTTNSTTGHFSSRPGPGEMLHAQLQQGGHSMSAAAPSHHQTTGLWDLANQTDMSYELAAAGTGEYHPPVIPFHSI